jgi:primosomal protein N' (replication factor Y)
VCYFTGVTRSPIRELEKKGLVSLFQREVYRRTLIAEGPTQEPPVLNGEQQAAFEGLRELMDAPEAACALLWGVTGSGKTQVYISLIHAAIARGRTALVLVPEIALTPQLLRLFEAQFGQNVAILHSSLPAGERYDEWKRALRGKAQVVVGTRSAVFAPLDNLGLIVLDEEQEGSYRSEQSPCYHAREVAKYRCAQSGGLLLLGSATPSVESMYRARQGVYHLFRLSRRYNEQAMPEVQIVDMRQELRSGNATTLSGPLRRELEANLQRGEQAVLFLNRRGTSRMAVCVDCGQTPECPNCSVKLTYHGDNRRLMCHHCGFSRKMEPRCPSCGGTLSLVDAGVQMVQEELEQAFPGTGVLRMDADSVSAANRHEDILRRFEQEKIPILLGTQMVAKGLDFENVTLVGALEADQGLYVDSYRAGERVFSLLTQVVGRAGRGSRNGRAVIQTFTPKNDIITCAARQDYEAFYEAEIQLRAARQAPPLRELYLLRLSGMEEPRVVNSARRLADALEQWRRSPQMVAEPFEVYGPAQAPVLRVMGRYRYRLTLLCRDTKGIRAMLAQLLAAFQQDSANKGVSLSVERDGAE